MNNSNIEKNEEEEDEDDDLENYEDIINFNGKKDSKNQKLLK